MPRLSIIIVNYNVKYFLEQALLSVQKAIRNIDAEVFVVDNASVDGSDVLIKNKFPWVEWIGNEKNVGFSVANNQAIERSKGEYILLLNPDTVVEEDTFEKCLAFMDDHPDAGGLGVKMLDGTGKFLPESKRGFPTPAVAFYKAFGLSSLFPKSKVFGRYHLGYLNPDQVHEVEVLAGAFMLMRKEVLDKIGHLDESFFMYGEDIDLSYRIIQAGYKNYYFPETKIIHYKGESTKKGSMNYVKMFYAAMKIFAKKHFSGSKAGLLTFFINLAIYFRAFIALMNRVIRKWYLPLLDAGIIFLGMWVIKAFWETNIKLDPGFSYPEEYLYVNVPLYIVTWLGAVYFSGGYDRPVRVSKIIRGLIVGTLVLAAIYGFLEEEYRFSRGMLILGAGWAAVTMVLSRWFLFLVGRDDIAMGGDQSKRLVIIGSEEETKRVMGLMNRAGVDSEFIGRVGAQANDDSWLGVQERLGEVVEVYKVEELIFCSRDISSQDIIHWMGELGSSLEYKIVPEESISIIGSNSKNQAGDIYSIDIQLNLDQSVHKRNKRVLDIFVSLGLLVTMPIQLIIVKRPFHLIANIFTVLFGSNTWVGYDKDCSTGLPNLRPGIITPASEIKMELELSAIQRLNMLYAKNYTVYQDLQLILKGFRNLGNRPVGR